MTSLKSTDAYFLTDNLLLFVDGSVNNHLKIGFGAYLVVNNTDEPLVSLKDKV